MRRRPFPTPSRRRGMSLAVVMIVLSTAVVLSIALLHSQTTTLRVVENDRAVERARQAAQTGLAAALDAIQRPTWTGVGTTLTAEVGRDTLGHSWYEVAFERIPGDGTAAGATAAALRVRIVSKGYWQAFGSARSTGRIASVDVALLPRLPGRPNRSGDIATTSDRAADVAGFAEASAYALCAVAGSDSLSLSPQTRIAGDVWVAERIDIFDGPSCTSTQLADLLTGLGTDSDGTSRHPLTGGLVHHRALDAAAVDALTRLDVARTVADRGLSLPAFDPVRYRKYRLFAGGFEYDAVELGPSLRNVSLGPTDANPLGVFYRDGDLSVGDNVVIRGTLVATSGITFDGRGIAVTPIDWRDANGNDPATDRLLWPILPAVVAGGDVTFSPACRVLTAGTVIADGDIVSNAPADADITGPLIANRVRFGVPPVWANLSASDWDRRHRVWRDRRDDRPNLTFSQSLAEYGLPFEPTVSVTRPPNVNYACEPPLFRPDPSALSSGGGYRWEILAWREVTEVSP